MANIQESARSSKKKFLIVGMVALFALALFLKPGLYEYDSYHFLSVACNAEWKDRFIPWTEYLFLEFLPCAEWAFKLWTIGVFAVFLFLAVKVGELFDRAHGWIFALTLFFGNSLMGLLARTENDNLGYLFVLASFYLVLSFCLRGGWGKLVGAVGLVVLGGFFWRGVWLWGVSLGLMVFWPVGVLVGVFGVLEVLRALSLTSEQVFGVGVFSTVFYWLFLPNLPRFLWLALIFNVLITLIALKYSFFLVLVLNVALFEFFVKEKFFENQQTPIGPKKTVFLGFAAVFFITACLSIITGLPNQQQIEQNHLAVQLANGNPIENDFENGHLITAFGGTPTTRFGPPNPNMTGPGIKITRKKLDCETINQIRVIDYNSTLYRCP